MTLLDLHIHRLRNIHDERTRLHPRFNFLYGDNGSGKTSFLEAIYLLSTGHSFRCREIASLISHEHDFLNVYAKTSDEQTISLQKRLKQPTLAKINQENCLSSSELAAFLPCQVFYQDIFQIIDAGPNFRRALLDWGVFHVEHGYHEIWKNYRRALKQRNTLLRTPCNQQEIKPWDLILSDTAEQLHTLRLLYFLKLQDEFAKILGELCAIKCKISYYKGWDRRNEGVSLHDVLRNSYHSDYQRQFTHYGVHHADIVIENTDGKAKNIFSRGQQKIVLFALKLAQSRLLNKPCILLIDDLSSELDKQHIESIMKLLQKLPGQYFITIRSGDNLISTSEIDRHELLMNNGRISSYQTSS